MSLSELHTQGGIIWMVPIDLLALACLALAIRAHMLIQSKKSATGTIASLQQIGGIAFAWGAFSTLVGLFQAFGALEASQDVIPFPVICGGLKVALITVLYGNLVYLIFSGWALVLKNISSQPA